MRVEKTEEEEWKALKCGVAVCVLSGRSPAVHGALHQLTHEELDADGRQLADGGYLSLRRVYVRGVERACQSSCRCRVVMKRGREKKKGRETKTKKQTTFFLGLVGSVDEGGVRFAARLTCGLGGRGGGRVLYRAHQQPVRRICAAAKLELHPFL